MDEKAGVRKWPPGGGVEKEKKRGRMCELSDLKRAIIENSIAR